MRSRVRPGVYIALRFVAAKVARRSFFWHGRFRCSHREFVLRAFAVRRRCKSPRQKKIGVVLQQPTESSPERRRYAVLTPEIERRRQLARTVHTDNLKGSGRIVSEAELERARKAMGASRSSRRRHLLHGDSARQRMTAAKVRFVQQLATRRGGQQGVRESRGSGGRTRGSRRSTAARRSSGGSDDPGLGDSDEPPWGRPHSDEAVEA